jgi:hypothetical protein
MSELRSGFRMHFDKLIQQPAGTPGIILQPAVYGPTEQARLLRDVLGLANAAGKGPRYIVFGTSRDQADQLAVQKLSERDLRELDNYPDLIARYIEPELRLECVIGNALGQMVAALVINASDNPPYIIRMDASSDLRRGDCWIREGGVCRPAQRVDFDRMYRFKAESRPPASPNKVRLGFFDDPLQDSLAAELPDVMQPPSVAAATRMREQIEARRAALSVNLEDTRLARLVHARLYGNEQRFEAQGLDTLIRRFDAVLEDYRDEDNYYYFEANALKLNFCIVNTSQDALDNVRVVLALPSAESFRVADRLYGRPDKPVTKSESELLGYPTVRHMPNQVQVTSTFDTLEPGVAKPLFEQALRISVRPELAGKKVALRYTLQANGMATAEEGRLKMTFRLKER